VTTLFEPIRIRGVEIPNRIVMPAMTTRLAAADGRVTPELIDYYLARAEGGVGLITVEMGSPHPAGRHRAREIGLHDDGFVPGLRELTSRLRAAGARAAVQIGHAGGHTREDVTGHPPVAPSALPHAVQEVNTRIVVPRELTPGAIGEIVRSFAEAAERMKRAGFDLVEIHGAHGYLIAQFLSPLDNRRRDGYGGSLRHRARFALEVVEACRERVGELPIIFRLSADEYAPGGLGVDEAKELARWLVAAGVDALHVSAGCYRSRPSAAVMTPPMTYPEGVFVHLAEAIKAVVAVPVIAVGRLHDPALAARVLARRQAEMVALGRQLIADPCWPRKVREGRWDEVRPCISCNTCVDTMRDGSAISCLVNPLAGRERRYRPAQAERSKRVLIAGGGPAGMEAASVLARRGHEVMLVEREDRLGGQLRLAADAPLFQNVETRAPVVLMFVEFLERQLARVGVQVRLGQAVSADLVQAWKPDVVVLATGASYRAPFGWLVPRLLASRWARSPAFLALLRRPAIKRLLFHGIRKPNDGLARLLAGVAADVRRIGDCERLGTTPEAMLAAAEIAYRL
jgi:2,4-dienoyl-CoA reductase-like NADH-dependent reductase (Old Yellow Enzyme family)